MDLRPAAAGPEVFFWRRSGRVWDRKAMLDAEEVMTMARPEKVGGRRGDSRRARGVAGGVRHRLPRPDGEPDDPAAPQAAGNGHRLQSGQEHADPPGGRGSRRAGAGTAAGRSHARWRSPRKIRWRRPRLSASSPRSPASWRFAAVCWKASCWPWTTSRRWPTCRPARCCWRRWWAASRRPSRGFVSVLQGTLRNLVYALDAVREQKGGAAG